MGENIIVVLLTFSASHDKKIIVWDCDRGEVIGVLKGHDKAVSSIGLLSYRLGCEPSSHTIFSKLLSPIVFSLTHLYILYIYNMSTDDIFE